jgi:hypothetical protein
MNEEIPSKVYFNKWIKKVSKNPYALEYCKFQTEEICLAAVKQNGWALQYVKKQTPEMCSVAVKQNGWALYYVVEQTFEIVLEAYQRNKNSLQFAKPEFKKMLDRKLKIDRLLNNE